MRVFLLPLLCLLLIGCSSGTSEDPEPVGDGVDAGVDGGEEDDEDDEDDGGDGELDGGDDLEDGSDEAPDGGDQQAEDADGDGDVDGYGDGYGDGNGNDDGAPDGGDPPADGADGDGDGDGDDDDDDDGDDDGDATDVDDGGDDGGDDGWVITQYGYQVVNSYPHDHEAFTQGLVWVDGQMYEGTGLRGSSSLRRVELETGAVLQIHELDSAYFGEGVAAWQDKLLQLTYTSQIGFVYDRETFQQLDTFNYATQGWGLTHDGSRLILSDGSAHLYFLDPETFSVTGSVEVSDQNGPVDRLNELEYIDGVVYANVWMTSRIVIIDPQDGRITGVIDLNGLSDLQGCAGPTSVLNGIAYDTANNRLFVTGKLWCKLFEIQLVEQ